MGVSLGGLVPTEPIELKDLAGKAIAIDAYNSLYQFLSIIRDKMTGEPLRDSKGRITSHLSGLFYRTAKFIENGIRPVYVFDGKPPAFKRHVTEERIKRRKEAEEKWKEALEAGRYEEARVAAQQAARLTPEMLEDSKQLLEAMGVAWVQAPSEGEAQAAHMVKRGLVWSVGSQDYDSLLFGAPRFVKNLVITGRRKLPKREKYVEITPEMIELEKVLKSLGISHDQLIVLGILVGTDYNPGGIEKVGPKTALKLVKEHGTLEGVMSGREWRFEVSAQEIFDFFKTPPVEDIKIKENKFDANKIMKIMVDEHDFSAERVQGTVQKLKELENKKTAGLGKFLGGR